MSKKMFLDKSLFDYVRSPSTEHAFQKCRKYLYELQWHFKRQHSAEILYHVSALR